MYDFPGGDDNHEWIEVFSSDCINLEGWKFFEEEMNHKIIHISGPDSICNNYAIIAEDSSQFLIDYPNFSGSLFDSSFVLKNSGETLAMKNPSGDIVEEIKYQNIFASGDRNTLERTAGNWFASEPGGTPGTGNNNVQIEPVKEKQPEPLPEEQPKQKIIIQEAQSNPIIEKIIPKETIPIIIHEKHIDNISNNTSDNIHSPITGEATLKTESDGFSLSLDIDPIEIIKSFFHGIWEAIRDSIDKSFETPNNETNITT